MSQRFLLFIRNSCEDCSCWMGLFSGQVSAQTGVKTMKSNDPIMHRGSNGDETNGHRGWGGDVSRETKSSTTLTLHMGRSAECRSRPFPCISCFPAGVTRGSARSWKETR